MSLENHIEEVLNKELTPLYLVVENESSNHHVPPGSQTHFKVTVVSEHFIGQLLIQRHKQVYSLFQKELESSIHALSLHLYTPEEWNKRNQVVLDSPSCKDGFKK